MPLPQNLEKCKECGAIMASLSNHSCDPDYSGKNPTRDEREDLIELDFRPDDSTVKYHTAALIYHETDNENHILCQQNGGDSESTNRKKMKNRTRSPCKSCLKTQVRPLLDFSGGDCNTCSGIVCHICDEGGYETDGRIQPREELNDHYLCERCYEGVLDVIDGLDELELE